MRQVKIWEALIPLMVLIIALYSVMAVLHIHLGYAVFAALLSAILMSKLGGVPFWMIFRYMWQGIKPTVYILIFFLLVGILIGIWHLSGTIPAMIYYGLKLVHPHTFYLSVFAVTSLVSLLLGTSMGTVSTVGVALIGIAFSLKFSLPITAGAIISGAFLGDRSSPVSSSANLTAVITQTELYSNLRHMMNTIAAPLFITSIIYLYLGQQVNGYISMELPILDQLSAHFDLGWLVLSPPLLVFILSLLRVKTTLLITSGILLGSGVAIFIQGNNIQDIMKTALFGYQSSMGLSELSQVIQGGGIVSFLSMELVILLSASLTGLMEGTGSLQVLLNSILSSIRSPRSLNIFSMVISILVCLLTANQTMAIIIPGKILLPLYKRLDVSPKNLARALSDSGVMVVSLIPWSVVGLLCTNILGVATASYLPFAFLCWLTPATAALFSLNPGFSTFIRMQKFHR